MAHAVVDAKGYSLLSNQQKQPAEDRNTEFVFLQHPQFHHWAQLEPGM